MNMRAHSEGFVRETYVRGTRAIGQDGQTRQRTLHPRTRPQQIDTGDAVWKVILANRAEATIRLAKRHVMRGVSYGFCYAFIALQNVT